MLSVFEWTFMNWLRALTKVGYSPRYLEYLSQLSIAGKIRTNPPRLSNWSRAIFTILFSSLLQGGITGCELASDFLVVTLRPSAEHTRRHWFNIRLSENRIHSSETTTISIMPISFMVCDRYLRETTPAYMYRSIAATATTDHWFP